jgi:hypothetical protein
MNKEDIDIDPIHELLVQQVKQIDTTDLSDDVQQTPESKEVEKQRIYIWIRLYIKEALQDLKEGDNFSIKWTHTGETLVTKFICYGKKGSHKDAEQKEQIQMSSEDDPTCLCLMVDEEEIQSSEEIPFIRTLFKSSKHFQYQVYLREDLQFINARTGQNVEYYDCDF